ncbi:hypothetical protein [Winogradskyella thalassocola]|uniref:Uncharacterized protein n=1 Tax=Winogradskyella thalassocola TaxID=262004 RepID=A0A1G8HC69_9FLAO|nr:hypothetical protein [Winogradskyella thalassocola]SDI04256.1 hypothetical protein SAMN04489796_106188 [Winogradskyella thalassocola]
MKQTEMTLGITILLLMILRLFFTYPYAALLISLLTLLLAVLYFVLSFGLLNQIRFRNLFKKESYKDISILRIIGTIGTGFVLSLISISVLFKFQRWPYGNLNLLIGLVSLLPILAIVIFKFFTHKNKFYRILLIRLSIFFAVGVLFYLTKPETLLELKFRDSPDYVEAVKNEMNDPENMELQEITDKTRLKMDSSK